MAEDKPNWAMDFSGFSEAQNPEVQHQGLGPKEQGGGNSDIERSAPRKISSRRASSGEVDSQLGSRSMMVGRFEFLGGAELHGELEGEILAKGDLILGESASIRASVQAERMKIFGQVEGDIDCEERIEAFAGARIAGNIRCPNVVMHDGVLFEGRCETGGQGEMGPAEVPELTDVPKT